MRLNNVESPPQTESSNSQFAGAGTAAEWKEL
jgi:hypothetical protein